MKQPKQFSALVIITIINNWAPIITGDNIPDNQHIRMISEESCDTEDWRNDVEKIQLWSQKYNLFSILKFTKLENNYFEL